MSRFFAGLFLILLAVAVVLGVSPVRYYTTPKQVRLYDLWQQDFQKLSKDPKFGKVFNNLAKVEVHFTDPQVAEEFANFRTPFTTNSTEQGFILKISITRWMEAKEYGFVIQHELFDQSEDKVYEFGRTYKVGLIF